MSTAAPTTVPPTTSAPTTVASTTAVPTTLLSTPVPTTTLTTVAPTTAVPGVDITAGPIDIVVSIAQVALHYYPPAAVNPVLDGYLRPDPIDIVVSISGYSGTVGIIAGSIDIVVSQHGAAPVVGQVIDQGPIDIVVSVVTGFEGLIVEIEKCNFVKWSKIGRLDFEIDESNLAGERPVDWKGCIWHLKKLGDKMIAYGDNGVTLLKPSGVHWGMETVYRIGLKNKGAMVGDDSTHFFVDKLGQLYQIDSKITKLDYSEFISQMSTVILTLDYEKQILYICDGTYGYVYGVKDKSFGEGPVNVTGFGVQTGNLYIVSAGEIVTPKFEICTDIYDLGTRKAKTIRSIEIGTDITQFLYASVDYKIDYTEGFKQIGWFLVNPNGVAHPRCYGHEFRFRLMSTVYEYFEIDWIKIKGMIHGFSWLDQFGNPSDD